MKTILQSSTMPPLKVKCNSCDDSCQGISSVNKRAIFEESSFEVYPHCVCFKPLKSRSREKYSKKGTRSTIKDFSKRSRFRLFTTLAKIGGKHVNKPIFLSLTYHYGHTRQNNSTKSNLHAFLVELRDFDRNVQFIWRIEYQKRGAPHYHLFIFPDPEKNVDNIEKYKVKISQIWHRIADPMSKAHKEYGCKIVDITNYRKACFYLNKYIAKLPEGKADITEGKHWGCSRNLPFKLHHKIPSNFETDKWILEKLRSWLLKNGKDNYASDKYFNVYRSQVIFIEPKEFYKLIDFDTSTLDFSDL